MKDKYYIGELAKELNISKRTILYYEDIGLIKSTRELVSNYRVYGKDAILRLQQIILFKKVNLPLNEIYKLVTLKNNRYAATVFYRRLNEIKEEISELSYSKNIIQSFINICNEKGIENIDVFQLMTELTCIDVKFDKIIGLSKLYEADIEIFVGQALIPAADISLDGTLIKAIKELRNEFKHNSNFSLPLIRVRDTKKLNESEYEIRLKNYTIIKEKIASSSITDSIDYSQQIINNLRKIILNNEKLFSGNREEHI